MGRKKKNTVFRYFDLTSQNGGAICLVNECRKLCKTQHSGNLLKHLQSHHKEQYNEVMELNKSREQLKNNSQQNTVSKNVLRECTNLVAVHGRPFSMLKDKAFQNLISMIPGNTSTINGVNVRENIKTTASKLRYEIANELKDKIISLKIDIASLGTRSFMGINCQYIQKGQIVLRNLGTIEIFERHTSEHLKDLLIFNLNRFHIDLKHNKHIYCITTDNGSNMIKMSRLINENCSQVALNTVDDNMEAGPSTCTDEITEIDDEYFEDTEAIMDHSLIIDNDMIDQAFTTRITDVLHAQLISRVYENDDYEVGIVRCAAHTLQLALQDACKDAMTSNMLASCREVVRRLRTPKFVRIIRQDGKNMPKLDCATRWHSAIDMVESLLSLRDICNSYLELHLPNSTWSDAQEFVQCLIPAKVLTKKLQGEQLTVGDFYLSWLFCQFQLTKINSKLATDIVESMKSREKLLFENDIFINGVFLDPRVNSLLPPDQQKRAKENLAKLYIQYFKLEHGMKESSVTDSTPTTSATSIETKENVEAQHDLDDYLNSSYLQKHDDVGVLIGFNPQFDILNALQQSLNLFLDEPLLKSTENVMIYWEKAKCKFPYLHKLSSVVIGAPMTQVSVERLFSSLKFVVSHYRLSMKDDIIEDLLFIRSNIMFNDNNS